MPEPLGVSGLRAERALYVGAVLAPIKTEADCSATEGRQRPVGAGGLHVMRYWSFGNKISGDLLGPGWLGRCWNCRLERAA